jgi:hypothetical protein
VADDVAVPDCDVVAEDVNVLVAELVPVLLTDPVPVFDSVLDIVDEPVAETVLVSVADCDVVAVEV